MKHGIQFVCLFLIEKRLLSFLCIVYVLLADTHALVDFVRYMQGRHLLETGKYVIISVEEEDVYDPKKPMQYLRHEFEAHDDEAKQVDSWPFRAVLMLTPSPPTNETYEHFQQQVNIRSHEAPFNIPKHPLIQVTVPIYAGLAYDAVMIYAEALTNHLKENYDRQEEAVYEGKEIFKHMVSRSYQSEYSLPNFDLSDQWHLLCMSLKGLGAHHSIYNVFLNVHLLLSPFDIYQAFSDSALFWTRMVMQKGITRFWPLWIELMKMAQSANQCNLWADLRIQTTRISR